MPAVTRDLSPSSPSAAHPARPLVVVLLVALVGASGPAGAADPVNRAAEALPAAVPSPTPDQPLTDSVDRIVEEVEAERAAACLKAREAGVPCFPVAIEKNARTTLEEALNRLRKDKEPYKGNPGQSPLDLNRRPQPPLVGYTFDPVCAAKAIGMALKGRSGTFYVYRVRDRMGEHIEMRERPLDPKAYANVAPFEMEPLGKFTGVCEAIAAHNKAQRDLREKERQRRLQKALDREAEGEAQRRREAGAAAR